MIINDPDSLLMTQKLESLSKNERFDNQGELQR